MKSIDKIENVVGVLAAEQQQHKRGLYASPALKVASPGQSLVKSFADGVIQPSIEVPVPQSVLKSGFDVPQGNLAAAGIYQSYVPKQSPAVVKSVVSPVLGSPAYAVAPAVESVSGVVPKSIYTPVSTLAAEGEGHISPSLYAKLPLSSGIAYGHAPISKPSYASISSGFGAQGLVLGAPVTKGLAPTGIYKTAPKYTFARPAAPLPQFPGKCYLGVT